MEKIFALLIRCIASVFKITGAVNYAYYSASALAKAQAKLIAAFQASELRYTDPAVYRLFLEQSPIMFPDYNQLRVREDRTVEAYYRQRTSRSLGTGRSHGHTGATGVSGVLTPAWTTYNDTFAISLKQADNNVYAWEEMFQNELENIFKNFIEGHETNATTYLMTNRSHVNAASFGAASDLGAFNSSNYVFEIPTTSYWGMTNFNTLFGQAIQTAMQINKYNNYTIVCDSTAYAKMQYMSAQGKDNGNNLSFQFNGYTYIHARKLAALAQGLGYTEGFAFAIPDGTIGCLPWIPKQNREGRDTKLQNYATMLNPFDNQLYAMHDYPVRADGTSTGGYTQDEVEQYEGSIDLAFAYAPLSNAGETPIMAFAISGSIT